MKQNKFIKQIEQLNSNQWPQTTELVLPYKKIEALIKLLKENVESWYITHSVDQDSHSLLQIGITNISGFELFSPALSQDEIKKRTKGEEAKGIYIDISIFGGYYYMGNMEFYPSNGVYYKVSTENLDLVPVARKIISRLEEFNLVHLTKENLSTIYSLKDSKFDEQCFNEKPVSHRLFGHY